MGSLRSNTRWEGLKIETSCYHSSGCSFDPKILKIDQEGCFDDFYVKFDYGSSGAKNRSHCPIIENPCLYFNGNLLTQLSSNLVRMLVLLIAWRSSNMGISDEKLDHRSLKKKIL
jgi:hypothetical protein